MNKVIKEIRIYYDVFYIALSVKTVEKHQY
jgi:hypothetical protein